MHQVAAVAAVPGALEVEAEGARSPTVREARRPEAEAEAEAARLTTARAMRRTRIWRCSTLAAAARPARREAPAARMRAAAPRSLRAGPPPVVHPARPGAELPSCGRGSFSFREPSRQPAGEEVQVRPAATEMVPEATMEEVAAEKAARGLPEARSW